MKKGTKVIRFIYFLGIAAMIIGIIDPLEGSVVISAGSLLVALSTHLAKDKDRKMFLVSFIMIVCGVFFMFFFSAFGGFGGKSTLSWWWGLLILPYPLGWLSTIILFIIRAIRKPN